jgi:hypothetical protein
MEKAALVVGLIDIGRIYIEYSHMVAKNESCLGLSHETWLWIISKMATS